MPKLTNRDELSQGKNPFEPNPYLAGSGYKAAKLTNVEHANWADMGVPPALENNACHVWVIGLDQSEESEAHFRDFLSAPELSRANQYYDPIDRKRYTIARGLLRILISHYLDQRPAIIQFEYGEHGKPMLPETALRFSKTSSAGLGLIAFCWESELGIDLEQTKQFDDLPFSSKELFSTEEQTVMQKASPSDRRQLFCNAWTRKEAVLKALGTGLSFPPDQLTVSLQSSPQFELAVQGKQASASTNWQLRSFSPTAGYQAALAIQSSKLTLSFFRFITSEQR